LAPHHGRKKSGRISENQRKPAKAGKKKKKKKKKKQKS
jgi:hypothetical protein